MKDDMPDRKAKMKNVAALVLALTGVTALSACGPRAPEPYGGTGSARVQVVFSGGHETDPVDHGRPVNLIAAGLGVAPEVFREAFSRVRPAPGGIRPTPERARQNKAVLMAALGPHGITNERLDYVSNYYRYNPQRGELWPIEEARVFALIEDGVVTGFEMEDGGSGYTSPPRATIPGLPSFEGVAEIAFGTTLESNGMITGVRRVGP